MSATTIHLVRHGDYSQLGRVLAGRMPGYSLSKPGREQADKVAAALARRPILAVVSSPLERAQETAAPIAARHGLDVTIDADLNEIDFGAWAGSEFAILHATPEWRAFNVFRSTAEIPGGETMLMAQTRGIAVMRRLCSRFPVGEVVAVSHGDVIKAVLAHFLGVALDLFARIEIAPASRTEIIIYEQDVRIMGVNLPPGV